MSINVRCLKCGRLLRAPADSTGRRAECPFCGSTIDIPVPLTGATPSSKTPPENLSGSSAPFESIDIENFLDPPASQHAAAAASAAAPKKTVWRQMFEAL